jgi:C-1-tetrahydrofolate synthase, mitochondrial
MNILSGSELSLFIKERQAKQVRALRQSFKVFPKLVILTDKINSYVLKKQEYLKDILIDCDIKEVSDKAELFSELKLLSDDYNVHGILVQFPILSIRQEELEDSLIKEKDVDGVLDSSSYISPVALAFMWLLSGNNLSLKDKKICVIGDDFLVARSIKKVLKESNLAFEEINENNLDLLKGMDVVINTISKENLITKDLLKDINAFNDKDKKRKKRIKTKDKIIVIDLAKFTASPINKDAVSEEVYDSPNIIINNKKGSIAPLLLSALAENVIASARKIADKEGQKDL